MTSSANIKWSSDASVAVWVIYTDRSKVTRVFEEVLRAPECALRFCYVVGQRSELPRQSHSHYWARLIKNQLKAMSDYLCLQCWFCSTELLPPKKPADIFLWLEMPNSVCQRVRRSLSEHYFFAHQDVACLGREPESPLQRVCVSFATIYRHISVISEHELSSLRIHTPDAGRPTGQARRWVWWRSSCGGSSMSVEAAILSHQAADGAGFLR